MGFAFDEDSKLTPFKLETRLESPLKDIAEPEAKCLSLQQKRGSISAHCHWRWRHALSLRYISASGSGVVTRRRGERLRTPVGARSISEKHNRHFDWSTWTGAMLFSPVWCQVALVSKQQSVLQVGASRPEFLWQNCFEHRRPNFNILRLWHFCLHPMKYESFHGKLRVADTSAERQLYPLLELSQTKKMVFSGLKYLAMRSAARTYTTLIPSASVRPT